MSSDPVNIYEYETLAKERLPQAEYDFVPARPRMRSPCGGRARSLMRSCCDRALRWISASQTWRRRCWASVSLSPSW
jgi:hypothetical protein